ncbi:5-formyltetrahydrofolate cyclo-ligase [Spiroplasma kunkelii CR2-3x]|uniref:5-formyltetrahydrofolate cyclo-ligase n=1 Tax=Spiroplasma kunkelii CR2-3x TaxID=273035 RepID=A0A0K2JFL9_SPIKU|nr:5-formyltetrahydrofolate cyclo-ligase [Spiroplasma kunkelii]ALA97041.1 5-formyltetrahydrofolate cyclo-ligase [Spiroplasma kunkelii CR2-3x]
MITRAKQEIRQEKLFVRSKISSELLQQKETQIFNTFFQHPGVQSKTIALYYSIKNEVNTIFIIKQLFALKINVLLPRMEGNNLKFYHITNLTTDLEFNSRFGLYEPLNSLPIIDTEKIDVLVVPIVAFDQNNFRLGYGKCYYDRFLKNYYDLVIGLAFIQ